MEKFLIVLFFLNKQLLQTKALTENGTGVCKKNSTGYFWLACCPGYRQNIDRCEDCPNGTTGENCQFKCPNNYYGFRCLSLCSCEATKTCDPVLGCTSSTESQNNEHVTRSYSTVTVVAILLLLLGLSFVVCRSNVLATNTDEENHYSEIRESMMVRPMTVYGRQLSIPSTSFNNTVDQYHHLSTKSSHRKSTGNNYITVDTVKTCEYVDSIEEEVSRIQQFTNTNNFKRGETQVNEAQSKPCENSCVDEQSKTDGNKGKQCAGIQSLQERNKELHTIVCDYKDESDIYSYARSSGNSVKM